MDNQENMYNVRFEMQNIDEIHDYFREVVEEEIKQEEVDRQEKIDNETDAIDEVGDYRRRQKKHEKDDDLRQVEEVAETAKSVMKDAFKGMLAGFSLGKVLDLALPREQLDNWTETRKEAIKAGFGDTYKEMKAESFNLARALNDKMGVAAIGGDEITEGLQQAIRSGIEQGMVVDFAKAATLAKAVGADLGDGVAEQFNLQFGKKSPQIIETLANVFGSTQLSEGYKSQIMSMVADSGQLFQNLGMDADKAARNYSSALAVMQKSNTLTLDQSKEMFDIVSQAARGNSDAMVQLAKLGVNVDSVVSKFKKADFGGVFQDVAKGVQQLPKNAEALKAMDVGIDESTIMRLQNAGSEVNSIQAKTNELVGESTKMIDGLTQAENRAKQVAESSWADRMQNWLGTTKMLEGVSDILERLNVDASTAAGAVGGVVSGAGSLFTSLMQTHMLMNASSGKGIMGLGTAFATTAKSIGGAVLAAGPWIIAIGAIAAGAYLIYKNWDTVVEYWDKSIDWISNKVDEFSNFFIECWNKSVDYVAGLPDKVVGLFNDMKDKALGVFNLLPDGVKATFNVLYDIMKNHPVLKMLQWGFDKVQKIGSKIKEWWKDKKGSETEAAQETEEGIEGTNIFSTESIETQKIENQESTIKEATDALKNEHSKKLSEVSRVEDLRINNIETQNLEGSRPRVVPNEREVQKVEIQEKSEPRTSVTVQNEVASNAKSKVTKATESSESKVIKETSSSVKSDKLKIDMSSLESAFMEMTQYMKMMVANTGAIDKNTKPKVEPIVHIDSMM